MQWLSAIMFVYAFMAWGRKKTEPAAAAHSRGGGKDPAGLLAEENTLAVVPDIAAGESHRYI